MTDWGKVAVSIVMWIILGFISIGSAASTEGSNIHDAALTIMVIAPLLIALFGTIAIWSPEVFTENKESNANNTSSSSKSKNQTSSKVDMLMQMMDADEQEAFKDALRRQILQENRLSSDGELPIDDHLFYDEEESHHRR